MDAAGAELVRRAREFAARAHGEQRYGDQPYLAHLEAVAALLCEEFGFAESPEILAAAWLHDVVEDTGTSVQALSEQFGAEIAAMVAFCSDEPGAERGGRKQATYARMRRARGEAADQCRGAIAVKLADRLANLRACATGSRPEKCEMYRLEHPAFRLALYVPGQHEGLWAAIEAELASAVR